MSSGPWPYGTPGAISYRCSESVSPAVFEIMGVKKLGSRHWPFKVRPTWRQRSREHSIRHMPFPVGFPSKLKKLRKLVLEPRGVNCHIGSHSVTFHPPQVNAPRLTTAISWYSIYLPRRDGRLSWHRLPSNAPAGSRTRDLSITSPTP